MTLYLFYSCSTPTSCTVFNVSNDIWFGLFFSPKPRVVGVSNIDVEYFLKSQKTFFTFFLLRKPLVLNFYEIDFYLKKQVGKKSNATSGLDSTSMDVGSYQYLYVYVGAL